MSQKSGGILFVEKLHIFGSTKFLYASSVDSISFI